MARALNGLKRLFTGPSDIEDNDDTLISYELCNRVPKEHRQYFKDKCKPNLVKYIKTDSFDEGKLELDKIWPKALARSMNPTDLKDYAEYMNNETVFINSPIVENMSIFEQVFLKHVALIQRLLQNFGKLTRDSIINNISYGNRVIISRLVESNTKNAFENIPDTLEQAIDKGIKPLIQLYLSPVESLEKSAKKEADFLKYLVSKVPSPATIGSLKKGRGISHVDFILQLRYLWLYLGTITFANALIKWQPEHFSFHFGNKIPSSRCTLIEMKNSAERADPENDVCNLGDSFFVQLYENGVGLDGKFYKVSNPYSSLDHELYEEFTDGQCLKSECDFPTIYAHARKVEDNLLHHYPQLVEALKQNKSLVNAVLNQNNLQIRYLENKNFQVPAIVDMWEQFAITTVKKVDALKLKDIKNQMDQATRFQNIIDLYLAKIREPIEGVMR